MRLLALILFLCLVSPSFLLADPPDGQQLLRHAAALAIRTRPATQPAPGFEAKGVQSLFFTGPLFHGKPTRVFAWYGTPANLSTDNTSGKQIPAMLLIHGGGGTAFASWVNLWTKRGYAALAIDTCGQLPRGKPHERDPQGGPPGWGGFDQLEQPVQDQWPFQAELDVILANSLLRTLPHVDPNRIGITGISWGGYLTCIAAALDPRFQFAIPVYGCGYLGEDSAWLPNFKSIGPQKTADWLRAFDPSQYLSDVRIPMLWVDGTNDLNYPFDSLRKSYLLPQGPCTFVTRIRMKHSHAAGWAPAEIYAFADACNQLAPPLAQIRQTAVRGGAASVTFSAPSFIVKADLNFTTDTGDWKTRKWQTTSATIDAASNTAAAPLPAETTAWYFDLTDQRNLIVSSAMVPVP